MSKAQREIARGRLYGPVMAAMLAVVAASPVVAQTQAYRFDIPPQTLASALKAYGTVANQQIVFTDDIVKGRTSPPLQGEYTADEALSRLLKGSGLSVKRTASGVLLIQASSRRSPQAGVDTHSESSVITEFDTITVTGTRISGVEDLAAPSFVFSREDIDRAGFTTLEQLFQSIPQNLNELSTAGSVATGVSRVANENSQNASGVSLRGLGPSATLVLLNGQRRPGNVFGQVFDVSAIPLSVIERVEVVTGGGSAIYGSDAVAGVVNIVTRREFEGAETAVSYGAPAGADARGEGGDRVQASQIFGKTWERGGFLAAYDYTRSWSLDATDAGGVGEKNPAGLLPVPGRFLLVPDSTRHSVLFSGHHKPTDGVELFADALYTRTDNQSDFTFFASTPPDPSNVSFQTGDVRSEQYSVTAGAKFAFDRWNLDVAGTYGALDNLERSASNSGPGGVQVDATTRSLSAVANGPLFSVFGNDVKAAFGVEHREEELTSTVLTTGADFRSGERSIDAIFGELNIPLVVDGQTPGLRGLELSLAGRYDKYSDVGGTFNPQGGLIWKPMDGLRVKAFYSEAFRAPDLAPGASGTSAFLFRLPDPTFSNLTPALVLIGADPNIRPETAVTRSLAVEFEPRGAPWLKLSASYFDIDYQDRIDDPAGANFFFALADEAALGSLINRAPTQADIDAAFAPILAGAGGFSDFTFSCFTTANCSTNLLSLFPNAVIFDNRRGNIAFETIRGIDFDIDTTFDSNVGQFSFGLNGTYYLDYERKITQDGLAIPQSDRPGKPVDLRLRGSAGWTRPADSVLSGIFVYVNYVDSYHDPLASPPSKISSWTTFDLTAQFDLSALVDGGLPDSFTATLGIQNVFDKAPPLYTGNVFSLNYDGANADTTGRFVSLRLNKRW